MNDAQIGLSVATPIIIVFAFMLHRMGVLQRGGLFAAILCSMAIATVLFLNQ